MKVRMCSAPSTFHGKVHAFLGVLFIGATLNTTKSFPPVFISHHTWKHWVNSAACILRIKSKIWELSLTLFLELKMRRKVQLRKMVGKMIALSFTESDWRFCIFLLCLCLHRRTDTRCPLCTRAVGVIGQLKSRWHCLDRGGCVLLLHQTDKVCCLVPTQCGAMVLDHRPLIHLLWAHFAQWLFASPPSFCLTVFSLLFLFGH